MAALGGDAAAKCARSHAGTPGDNQIASYTYDCDLFLTGDKVIVAILDRVRPHAPKPVALARRLRPDLDPVGQIKAILDELG